MKTNIIHVYAVSYNYNYKRTYRYL